jgi:hypothetical protein
MRLIGLRATPHRIYYSVIDNNDEAKLKIANQTLIIPVSFDFPRKLKYVRKTLIDIFNEYDILRAGIRITEHNAQNADAGRIMIEGVVQELLASSKVEKYFTGVKNSIAAKLGLPADGSIGSFIDGAEIYNNIKDWSKFSKEHRECILTALAAYNL